MGEGAAPAPASRAAWNCHCAHQSALGQALGGSAAVKTLLGMGLPGMQPTLRTCHIHLGGVHDFTRGGPWDRLEQLHKCLQCSALVCPAHCFKPGWSGAMADALFLARLQLTQGRSCRTPGSRRMNFASSLAMRSQWTTWPRCWQTRRRSTRRWGFSRGVGGSNHSCVGRWV